MPSMRQFIIYGSLAATLAATLWGWISDSDDAIVEPASRSQARMLESPAGKARQEEVRSMSYSRMPGGKNLFATSNAGGIHSGAPLAVEQSLPVATQATGAALPFEFLGRQQSGGNTYVFVSFQDRTLSLKEGDTIDSQYRLQHIKTNTIEWLHLPDREKIVMTIERGQP